MFVGAILATLVTLKFAQSNVEFLKLPLYVSHLQLSLDSNDRLLQNHLLFLDSSQCKEMFGKINIPAYRKMARISEEFAKKYFQFESESCSTVCLEKGTSVEYLLNPLPQHIQTDEPDLNHWIENSCQRTEVGFVNYLGIDASVFYVSNENEEIYISHLGQMEANTVWQQSYLGHRFVIRSIEKNEILSELTLQHNCIHSLGSRPSMLTNRTDDIPSRVEYSMLMEWERSHRVQRTFTPTGFSKGRLPRDLFGSMSAYYYNNRANKQHEEWDNKGVFVNWWETSVYVIPMPWELKTYWQSRLKDLVEAWSGVELELTDIYGMRQYENGARLLTHVDREATHAASLIINVAQGGMHKPWNVEIYDFADRLHEVEMDEGDIVYYESARCLHGRMQPLDGAFYVNLFAHYRPVGDPAWFTRSNPVDGPAQLLDLGKCRSNGTKVMCTKASEDEIPFLSPTLQQLKGPNDLFQYWKKFATNTTRFNHDEL